MGVRWRVLALLVAVLWSVGWSPRNLERVSDGQVLAKDGVVLLPTRPAEASALDEKRTGGETPPWPSALAAGPVDLGPPRVHPGTGSAISTYAPAPGLAGARTSRGPPSPV